MFSNLNSFCAYVGQGGPCGRILQDIAAFPGQEEYDKGTTIYNQAYSDVKPAFVAFPLSESDVQRCLQCSITHSVPCTVKSGGHSSAGYSTINGSNNNAFVISLAKLNGVVVSGDKATVGTGARWADVYAKLSSSQLVVGGLCPSVGVAGYVLGGGFGAIHRKYGMAIDNVLSMTMVTANGARVVLASDVVNPGLFWALRGGGGGNFGVVTSITLKVHESTYSNFVMGMMDFEVGSKSQQALSTFGQIHANLPRELNLDIVLLPSQKVRIALTYLGNYSDCTASLAPLMDLASATNFTNYTSFVMMNSAFSLPDGNDITSSVKPHYINGCILSKIDYELADIFFKTVLPSCISVFVHLGGAISDIYPNETAFFYRNAPFQHYFSCKYSNESQFKEILNALNKLDDSLVAKGYCVGNYVNDMDRYLKDWQDKYYGGNYQRLLEIKKEWNPLDEGYFHFAQEIGAK